MKKLVLIAAMVAVGISTPVLAKNHKKAVDIVERDARGKATKVRINGQEIAVCTSDNSDGCINPREAGLGWGNSTAKTWPGRPISREN
jgi:hypothetical protein